MASFVNNTMTISGPIKHKRATSAVLEASSQVFAAGEIVVATDTGQIKAGDGVHRWAQLPSYDGTTIVNNLTTEAAGSALDAAQGKALNDRIVLIEGITTIDCGEVTAGAPEQQEEPANP